MRFSIASTAVLLLAPSFTFSHPQAAPAELQQRDAFLSAPDQPASEASDHWKRKGGGGGGGGKGGGGGGGGKTSGSSSSGGSSSSSSSSSSSGGGGRTGGSSNLGGATSRGSGVTKNYGGGKYYGGGAATPYASGGRSPKGIVAAPILGVALLAYPGLWLYGAYSYPYHSPYSFRNRTSRRNRTATSTTASAAATATAPTKRSIVESFYQIEVRQTSDEGEDQVKPVTCLCAMYAVCGCDDNDDTSFLDAIIGDGDYNKLNASLVQVADIEGKSTIILNGTLPNGTTAAGGVDDTSSARPSSVLALGGSAVGYWAMIALVGAGVYLV